MGKQSVALNKLSSQTDKESVTKKYGTGVMKFYEQFRQESTIESQVRLNRNRDYLKSIPKFTFELDRELNSEVRELLETIKLRVSVQDVKDLEFGSYFREDIYGLYLKMLSLFN